MPDRRRHRGPAPEDAELFADKQLERLASAVRDLSWLDGRGYARPSAVELVGNRYQLHARQRVAVGRSACSDEALRARQERRIEARELAGERLEIDGYNQLTTIEAALAGGVLLEGRDGFVRDMASLHGTFRAVEETEPALELLLRQVEALRPSSVLVLFDAPIANSGRLAARLRNRVEASEIEWEVELDQAVDPRLRRSEAVVATADAGILDGEAGRRPRSIALSRLVIERESLTARLLRFGGD